MICSYLDDGKNLKLLCFGIKHPLHKYTEEELIEMAKNGNTNSDCWQKVEDKIFKFEKEGDTVTDELLTVEESRTYNNKVYKIKTEKETVTVFGTSVLDSQMTQIKIGQMVRILFSGTKPDPKGRNDIKLFEVFFK
jgi:hypothetical protein